MTFMQKKLNNNFWININITFLNPLGKMQRDIND